MREYTPTIQPIALGVHAEELYCLFSEHLIYLYLYQDEWSRATQRKIAQILILTREAESEDRVTEVLHTLSQDVPKLEQIDDQITARLELAAFAEYITVSLAARFTGSDRAAYDTGVFIKRIGLCAGAAVIPDGGSWWQRKRNPTEKISKIYQKELLRAAEALRDMVDISNLDPTLAWSVKALLSLALSGKRYRETYELAENIMVRAGLVARSPLK